MTPEHTDRDLRERAQALLDAWDAHGYMRPSSLAAAFGDLRAALTASEGPRVCPRCGSDDPQFAGRGTAPAEADPGGCGHFFHGIEASEGVTQDAKEGQASPPHGGSVDCPASHPLAGFVPHEITVCDDCGNVIPSPDSGHGPASDGTPCPANERTVLVYGRPEQEVRARRAQPHTSHCCPIHGCKYGDAECPVVDGNVLPEYPKNNGCERCEYESRGEPAEVRGERVTLWRIMASWEPMHRSYQAAKDHPAYEVATFQRIPTTGEGEGREDG